MRQNFVSLCFLFIGILWVAKPASAQSPPPPGAFPPAATAAPRAVAVRLTLSPEWGYRVFRDLEPSSTDKLYNAPGVPLGSVRLELYPLAFVSPAIETAKDIGITGGYSRAFGLTSRDIDTDSDVDTQWYQFNFGLRYRLLGGSQPLALGLTLGIQRWVFDFVTDPTPPDRPVPIARYTLLPVGADVRHSWPNSWGNLSVFADGRFLLPLTVSPLGSRTPSGARLGGSLSLGAAVGFLSVLELELRASYTLLYLSLPAVAGRADEKGTVLDQYLVFSAGASFVY